MPEILLFQYLNNDLLDKKKIRPHYLAGFETAAEIGLPSPALAQSFVDWQFRPYQMLIAPSINFESVLCLEYEYNANLMAMHDWRPFPLTAVIVPILNSAQNGSNWFDIQHQFVRIFASEICWNSAVPLIVVCINDAGIPPFLDYTRPDWWKTARFREYLAQPRHDIRLDEVTRRDDYVREHLTVLEMPVDEMASLPEKLAGILKLAPAPIRQPDEKSYLRHPTLPFIKIQYPHIGGGEQAVMGFIEDCARGLLEQGADFKIWVDAMAAPHVDISDAPEAFQKWMSRSPNAPPQPDGYYEEAFVEYELIQTFGDEIKKHEYWLMWDEMTIATPHIEKKSLPTSIWDVYQTVAAYHVYLEYAGMVYDGMTALNQPIPLVEYQNHFAPVFRKSVASASTLEATLAAVNGLVLDAKYQR